MHSTALLALVLGLLYAQAAVVPLEKRTAAPVITASTGIYTGATASKVDRWLGIPYAYNPTGGLRFASPVLLPASKNKLTTTAYGPRCFTAEACLNVNVFRPTGTKATAKLPVVVYIFGGSFDSGGASAYNPQAFVLRSVAIKKPVVFVTFDYRLGALGFLAGPELQAAGALNLGLQDQHAALKWVKNNIASFGGNPSAVTIWGQSAGAISVGAHLAFNGGAAPPFRAAILESGSLGTLAPFGHTSTWPARNAISKAESYEMMLTALGCATAADKLACLRAAPYASIMNAQYNVVGAYGGLQWGPTVDGKYIPNTPSSIYASGALANVPIIAGDVLDEATIFLSNSRYASAAINTPAQLAGYLANLLPTAGASAIQTLMSFYPDTPSAGLPFNTGTAGSLWPEFKRAAAIFGDLSFLGPKRKLLSALNSHGRTNVYSYIFSEPTGQEVTAGVSHGSDYKFFYGNAATTSTAQKTLMNAMTDYFIYFANSGSPNGGSLTKWPAYNAQSQSEMQFQAGATKVIADTARAAGINYINNNPTLLGQ